MLASKGVIPEDVKMNNNFMFLDLQETSNVWSKKIRQASAMERIDYKITKMEFMNKGYDIETEVKKLERLLVK